MYIFSLLFTSFSILYSEEITIFPSSDPVIIIPSMSDALMPALTLTCGLEPETLIPGVNYTTRWTLPAGETINSTRGRFDFIEDHVVINDTLVLSGTNLTVTLLSYQDAGTYTCEGRGIDQGASTQWAAASIELQLNCEFIIAVSENHIDIFTVACDLITVLRISER